MTYDEIWLLAVNQGLRHPVMDGLMTWVSTRWTFAIPVLVLLLLHAWRDAGVDGARVWLVLVLAVVVGDAAGDHMKDLVAEPRPCAVMAEALVGPGGAPLPACGGSGSMTSGMPSNHALNFFLAATMVALITPWRGWALALLLMSVAVALSRVYLGRHYPSQVAAGALIGMGFGMLASAVACYYRLRLLPRRASRLPQGGSDH